MQFSNNLKKKKQKKQIQNPDLQTIIICFNTML